MGAGGAGLRAAMAAHEGGARVVVVSKSLLGKAHTVMAEGGIAAAVANVDSGDSWKTHFSDTLAEGVYIGDWEMIELLVKEAPERVHELERHGALFDRTPDGRIMQRAFGGHTYRRLCHVGDRTGLEMIRTMEEWILHKEITVMDELVITKLFAGRDGISGALGLSMRDGLFLYFRAKCIIIATGGAGRIYRTTSNSWETNGDGMALAYDAGAVLQDMEMVQFHPTGMVYPPGVKGLLVTEGVRGEGGILLNSKGERFMLSYSPEKRELDARDIVARAIHSEIVAGRGTRHGGVYLDISQKGRSFILKKLPSMYEQFMDFAGIDITRERMEVAPTVHYFMGGIRVDPRGCATSVKGLFAAGEAASGLHGANRLGGNSLADILVFGRRAGMHAAEYAKRASIPGIPERRIGAEIGRINSLLKGGGANPNPLIDRLRDTMSEKMGIVRSGAGMKSALSVVRGIRSKARHVSVGGGLRFNQGLIACIELGNMAALAECMIMSALERKESRGAHARSDYPKKSPKWKGNITCVNSGGRPRLSFVKSRPLPRRLSALVKKEAY
jgi:succinate dehydrogenase / fumarate reductase flavoprotein subunit